MGNGMPAMPRVSPRLAGGASTQVGPPVDAGSDVLKKWSQKYTRAEPMLKARTPEQGGLASALFVCLLPSLLGWLLVRLLQNGYNCTHGIRMHRIPDPQE